MPKERLIAICADDYGLSYAVSAGILQALGAGRLTAVSCMTNMPRWPAMGRELARHAVDADVGLHFNLTLGRPLGPMPKFAPNGEFPSVSAVIRQALAHKLPLEEIRAEIDRQFDRFEAVMERRPDFLDGHQHIHALPGLRGALLDAMEERGLTHKAWLRDAGDGLHRIFFRGAYARKALAVRTLAAGFKSEAKRRGFLLNDGFSGFSSFEPGRDYARQFETYLRAPGKRHLIMCHPGHVDDELRALDPVTITREQELAFLLSPRFEQMLETRRMRLGRLIKGETAPAPA